MSNINRGERGKWASIEGFANEKIVCGLLMKRYGNVSLVDLPLSPYDIILVRKIEEGKEDIIRLQVKTASDSLKFTGGERGWVGDVPRMQLSVEKLRSLGWSPGVNSRESVRKAVKAMLK